MDKARNRQEAYLAREDHKEPEPEPAPVWPERRARLRRHHGVWSMGSSPMTKLLISVAAGALIGWWLREIVREARCPMSRCPGAKL